ncbi:SDR family oxidoreductase [Nocardioides marmoriginsengisoli]|uniref:SDR family oxidoreductase n=1 Tax=Nocardioides marmoriginsengisoli TaxID=661483 RepID=A0A3N0CCZ0_9ACTN|nr:mycofactocin-coupled SDR family oxidoreductase [Nocardioides marmoriginsengisoli]RNL61315.1 SDR family oxidoreductase [Nocardioides marmoriginsengisoli]
MTRVALVTGAARGIGAATVDLLCEQGMVVAAVDWPGGEAPSGVEHALATAADLDRVAARHPGLVLPYPADVRDRVALDRVVADLLERYGRIDVAVAAAAVIVGGLPLWEHTPEQVGSVLGVDALGVWNTASAVIPAMLAGPDPSGCRFVAVTSPAGEGGLFGLGGYVMAKHACVGVVRALAADLTGTGVVACGVSPGSTRTDMLAATAALYDLDDVEPLADAGGLQRLLEPVEVARVIAFCCSAAGTALNGSIVAATGTGP